MISPDYEAQVAEDRRRIADAPVLYLELERLLYAFSHVPPEHFEHILAIESARKTLAAIKPYKILTDDPPA